jgi:hypothetical protein
MSHLPLMPGDDIRIFILAPNYPDQKDGLTCYPNDRYTPIGFPIFAEYDDDVQVRNIREINEYNNRYFHEFATVYVKKNYSMMVNDEEQLFFEKYEWTDTEEFVRDVIYGQLYVDRDGKKMRLEHVMVHGKLYHNLIKNISNRIPYGQTETFGNLMERKILKTIEWLKEDDEAIAALKSNEKLMAMFGERGITLPCFKRFTDRIHIDQFTRWNSLDKMARYLIETDDYCIFDDILNYIIWNQVMHYSRYGYHCISGGGSQCQEMMLQKVIADFVLEKCSERELDVEDDFDGNVLEETLYWWDD